MMASILRPFFSELELGLGRARPRTAGAVVESALPEAVAEIRDPGTAMVVRARRLPVGLERVLAAWAPHAKPVDTVVDARTDLASHFAGLAPGPLRDWLVDDVHDLVATFVAVAGVTKCRITAAAVRNDACRKFHVDHVRLRLVTTYLGPGTEWVGPENVDFAALDHDDDCDCATPPSLVRRPHERRIAGAGDVLVMKGELYGNDVRGQVHRSPPIEGTGIVRFVVTLTVPGRFF